MARHLRTKHPMVFRTVAPYLDKTPIKGPLRSTSWTKGSWARKYCQKLGGCKWKCDMCGTVLSLSNGLFGNMKRHIKNKHPLIYDKEVGGGRSDDETDVQTENEFVTESAYLSDFADEVKLTDNEEEEEGNAEPDFELPPSGESFLKEDDPEFEIKVKYLVTKQISGRRRARNCFWNFFNVVQEDRLYTCLACNKNIAIFPHSIANMKRHIKNMHKYQYDLMMKYMNETDASGKDSPVSFDKYYFSREGDNEFKCKECDSMIICMDEDQLHLFDHIKDFHPDQIMAYQEEDLDTELDTSASIVIVNEVDDLVTIQAAISQ